MKTRTQTRQERKAALIAAVKCIGCGIGLGQGQAMFSIGGGQHECATRLKTGACA